MCGLCRWRGDGYPRRRSSRCGGGVVALDRGAGRSRPAHQQRSARRRENVLAAVAALLARGGSVTTITIDEICAEADVSRSSLYLRWPSKDALWADVAVAYLDDATATVERTRAELADVTDLGEFVEAVGVALCDLDVRPSLGGGRVRRPGRQRPACRGDDGAVHPHDATTIGAEVAERLPDGGPLPLPAQQEMARLVEVLLGRCGGPSIRRCPARPSGRCPATSSCGGSARCAARCR